MIRWLLGPTIASAVFAFLVVRIFDTLVSGATGAVINVVRPTIFAGTWASTTAASGMRGFDSRVRKLLSVRDRISDVLSKRERR